MAIAALALSLGVMSYDLYFVIFLCVTVLTFSHDTYSEKNAPKMRRLFILMYSSWQKSSTNPLCYYLHLLNLFTKLIDLERLLVNILPNCKQTQERSSLPASSSQVVSCIRPRQAYSRTLSITFIWVCVRSGL